MKNNRGYTVVELIVVIVVVGVLAFVGINKASYAFSDQEVALEKSTNFKIELIEKQAVKYGEDHKELFEESTTTYIRVIDLIENKYLLESENDSIGVNQKIKLEYKDENVTATFEK